jgi:hypothetical protein
VSPIAEVTTHASSGCAPAHAEGNAPDAAPFKRVSRYECGGCYKLHERELAAQLCCAPSSAKVYVCGGCNEPHASAVLAMTCEMRHRTDLLYEHKCPVCTTLAESVEAATECCLCRAMSHSQRRALVSQIEVGSPIQGSEALHAAIRALT